MKIYNKYLICYDIEDDKIRRKFFEKMKDFGLVSIQKSVFYGDLTVPELTAMKNFAFELLDQGADKCLWIRCNLDECDVQNCIGYKDFRYMEPDGHATI
ncbi:MAG: CRISPR-associated endonuclease Cas2 [Succinivibrionaceae bacterium]|nr:CRISPR-associated endonuclease Cas2 [Ruminobacter sp.]MEE1340705.1 CRISPR-associated endonuclease Cas2 [Succinivibrionaceae bacterium]